MLIERSEDFVPDVEVDGLRGSPAHGSLRRLAEDAIAAWCVAHGNDMPVQPALYRALMAHRCDMLTPVFAGLFQICETCLRRRLAASDADAIARLLSEKRGACETLDRDAASDALRVVARCAICSTRIMLAMVLASAPDGPHRRAH